MGRVHHGEGTSMGGDTHMEVTPWGEGITGRGHRGEGTLWSGDIVGRGYT